MQFLKSMLNALHDLPQRIRNSLRDPLRRRNLVSRCVEGYLGGLAVAALVAGGFSAKVCLAGVLAPLVEFCYYEFFAEPMEWSGYYWERGERDGEVFKYP